MTAPRPPASSATALVDLDGTITDPARGLIGAFRYALEHMGAPVPEPYELTWVIGPPLRVAFPRLLGPDADIERAVALYREFYSAGGITDADVYAGIPEALAEIRRTHSRMYVCTAKPRVFAERVLAHFELTGLFDGIYGPELNGHHDDKAELMAHIIASEGLSPSRAVMIGDRDNDVRAARANGVPCVGVLWGYGSAHELTQAGAHVLCEAPTGLASAIRAATAG